MIHVNRKEDLNWAYSYISFAKSMFTKGRFITDKEIIKTKQEIRKFNKMESDRRVVHEDGIDSVTFLVACPDEVRSEEDANDWFECEERREYRPSPYDCTGQAFTIFRKFVLRSGRWYCYHKMGFDV